MKKQTQDWKVIFAHFDLNERVQVNVYENSPKLIGREEFKFFDKNEAIRKYCKSVKEFMGESYDWKGHSMAAFKAYYEDDAVMR
jgi:hypothetical protein